MDANNKTAFSFPFLPILTLIFVVAKLWGVINWSWWVVFLPMWLPITLVLGGLAIFGLIMMAVALAEHISRK